MTTSRRLAAEFLGTFWVVFCGCGSAVIAARFPGLGIGLVGVALAFGLATMTMAYALRHVSGAHFNPAVTVGLVVARRFPAGELAGYVGAQLLGALAGATTLYAIASGRPGFSLAAGFAANGYGAHSPGGYGLAAAFTAEVVLTLFFVMVTLGATDRRTPAALAPLAVGIALTLVYLIGIPITNASVNPARSTAPAAIVGGSAVGQLWLFWLAPLAGAVLAGVIYPIVASEWRRVGEPVGPPGSGLEQSAA
jgi:aquaporin Z